MNPEHSTGDFLIPVIAGTLLVAALIAFIIYFIFLYKTTQQKFDWERQQFKHALLQSQVEIREHTLTHVSRELHDNLGHIASLIKINLNMLSNDLSNEDKYKINESIELIRQLINDIKLLSKNLNSENLKRIGLSVTIVNDIERINKTGNIKIIYSSNDILPTLKAELEVFLYRMYQEILNNILQHAHATEAEVTLNIIDKKLCLEVNDNGKGFDFKQMMENSNKQRGSGLSSLTERCKIIGAECQISSMPGAGTKIQIALPIT